MTQNAYLLGIRVYVFFAAIAVEYATRRLGHVYHDQTVECAAEIVIDTEREHSPAESKVLTQQDRYALAVRFDVCYQPGEMAKFLDGGGYQSGVFAEKLGSGGRVESLGLIHKLSVHTVLLEVGKHKRA